MKRISLLALALAAAFPAAAQSNEELLKELRALKDKVNELEKKLGGAAAAAIFYFVLAGAPAGGKWNSFLAVSNVYGGAGHFPLAQVLVTEVVITALFLIVIVGATSKRAPAGFAPIAIGLALTFFHLVSIPVSNASLNPARSTATAIFGGAEAVGSLWLFWVAPIIGGLIGGLIGKWLQED